MSYLTWTRPPTSLSTPTPTSSPKVTSCLLALHYCSFCLEQLCLACPHTPCLPGKLVIPPPSCTRPLDGPFSGRAEEPFWKSAGLFPAPGLCTCCFLCLSTSFSSSTNKLQLTFKTWPSGHLLCEALLDAPVRTSYLPPPSSPRPLHHSPVTICICDDSPPHPGGPLGQGWGLSLLGSPRETLESCTNTFPILSQPLCCLRLETLVPVMSRPCPQAPSLAREF